MKYLQVHIAHVPRIRAQACGIRGPGPEAVVSDTVLIAKTIVTHSFVLPAERVGLQRGPCGLNYPEQWSLAAWQVLGVENYTEDEAN